MNEIGVKLSIFDCNDHLINCLYFPFYRYLYPVSSRAFISILYAEVLGDFVVKELTAFKT